MAKIQLLLILLCSLFVASCINTGSSARVNAYTDPGFDPKTLKSVAILPMRNAQLALADAMLINRSISETISRSRPDINVVGPEESVSLINTANMTEDCSNFLVTFSESGIPNRKILKDLGKAMKVASILQGQIVSVTQKDGDGWQFGGFSAVTVRYSLLSTEYGTIIWDATAEGHVITNSQSATIIETVAPAINKIFQGFPLSPTNTLLPGFEIESNPIAWPPRGR